MVAKLIFYQDPLDSKRMEVGQTWHVTSVDRTTGQIIMNSGVGPNTEIGSLRRHMEALIKSIKEWEQK